MLRCICHFEDVRRVLSAQRPISESRSVHRACHQHERHHLESIASKRYSNVISCRLDLIDIGRLGTTLERRALQPTLHRQRSNIEQLMAEVLIETSRNMSYCGMPYEFLGFPKQTIGAVLHASGLYFRQHRLSKHSLLSGPPLLGILYSLVISTHVLHISAIQTEPVLLNEAARRLSCLMLVAVVAVKHSEFRQCTATSIP